MSASSNKYKHSENLRSYVLAVLTLPKKTDIAWKSAPGSKVSTAMRRRAPGLRSIITSIKNTLIDYEVIDWSFS